MIYDETRQIFFHTGWDNTGSFFLVLIFALDLGFAFRLRFALGYGLMDWAGRTAFSERSSVQMALRLRAHTYRQSDDIFILFQLNIITHSSCRVLRL